MEVGGISFYFVPAFIHSFEDLPALMCVATAPRSLFYSIPLH